MTPALRLFLPEITKNTMSDENPPSSLKPQDTTTRRKFIAGTAAAAAATSALPVESYAQVAGSDELKIGMVGCGGRGSGAIVQDLKVDGTRLVAMADAFEDRLMGTFKQRQAGGVESIQKELEKNGRPEAFDVPESRRYTGFDAYKQVIDQVDVVVIATPPGFRPIHFEYAVQAGKHVFMEKPVCVDAAGFNRVIEAAKVADEKNLKVVVGLQRHYQESYLQAFEKMKEGLIGDIVSAQCWWNSGGVWKIARQPGWSEMEYQMRNWYYFNWLCGDHITEQHIHNIDVINWFVSGDSEKGGHPTIAQGMGGREVRTGPDTGEIFDHHYVEFRYDNGVIMNSQCRHQPGCLNKVEEEIHGTEGSIYMGNKGKTYITDRKGNEIWTYRNREPENPYDVEHVKLHEHIREDKPINNAYYGAKSSFTSVFGRLATYSGVEVNWDEAIASNFSIMPEDYSFDAEPPILPDADGNYPTAKPGEWLLPWKEDKGKGKAGKKA